MARTYVLDTNVLLFDPKSLFVFEEHKVVIPLLVIEEIDRFKKDMDETGRNARTVSRYLDKLRERGSLRDGVELRGGGTLKVVFTEDLPNGHLKWDHTDNAILTLAKDLSEKSTSGDEVVLVSRDTNMRIKGDAVGLHVEDYRHDKVVRSAEDQYKGWTELSCDAADIDLFYEEGCLPLLEEWGSLFPHEFAILSDGGQKSALARVSAKGNTIHKVDSKVDCWGIRPRNKEQAFAFSLLLDPKVQLVTLSGQAGTGKTLAALAAGLHQVCGDLKSKNQTYRKMLVARPIFPMGRDIGYLPGSLEEKLNPWMQPIFDNLELIISGSEAEPKRARGGGGDAPYQYLLDAGHMQVEALTYIRGRSIPKHFMIIDEAQNLTPHEVKTILTRAGEGTKIILTGDPQQIDNPYVDATSNGLTYVIERFKDSPIAGHVTFSKGERSELADAASKLL